MRNRKCRLVKGRPNGSCPLAKNDDSVAWSIADLFLCPDCSEFRFASESDNMVPTLHSPHRSTGDGIGNISSTLVKCELLYFIQNKVNILSFDSIVLICADFYTLTEVEAARSIVMEKLATTRRLTKHTGSEEVRRKKTVQDLVKLCLDPNVKLPSFYSLDMARIPAVGSEHVDVSALLQEVSALRVEVRTFATIRAEISSIRDTLKESHASIVTPESAGLRTLEPGSCVVSNEDVQEAPDTGVKDSWASLTNDTDDALRRTTTRVDPANVPAVTAASIVSNAVKSGRIQRTSRL